MSSSRVISSALQADAAGAAACGSDAWTSESAKTTRSQPLPGAVSLLGKNSLAREAYGEALRLQPASPFVLEMGVDSKASAAGYASSIAALATTAAKAASGSSSSKAASTSGTWGFLNDTKMSIEDKLFQFIKLVQKKNDDELTKKMNEYRDKYGKKDDGGGLFGFLGGTLGSIFSGGWLKDALEQIGGLLGKAGAAALGLTPLGSIAKSLGEKAGGWVAAAIGAKNGSSGSSEKGEAGSPDERLDMLEIQRLADKQKQLFDCVSNILRVIHETGMTAVNNIR